MDLTNRIIDYISRNRVSSVQIADALGKRGVVEGVSPLNRNHFVVGKVFYAFAYGGTNYHLHRQLEGAPEDAVVLVEGIGCGNRALFGDLVSKYLILYKKVRGIVVKGALRDAHRLIKENYPIWCSGVTPLGCHNEEVEIPPEVLSYVEEQRRRYEGGIIVCDDSGCTLIERELVNADLLRAIEFIEVQEDIWYYCIDTLKWSTFEVVCQKRYLQEPETLPGILKERLMEKKR